jgi:hypothetical protein
MNRRKNALRLGALASATPLGAASSNAAQAASIAGHCCTGVIQSLTIADDAVCIRLVDGTVGLTNCTACSQIYFMLPRSSLNHNSYYAMRVAACTAKEGVTLRSADSSANCMLACMAAP